MSKSIKVSDEVYHELLRLQRTRETFSDIVARLLRVNELMWKAIPLIEGERERLERTTKQLETIT